MEDLDVPVGEEEKEVVKIMFEEEFNRTPYDAQIEVISQMVYSQKDHLLVRGTGGGKSGVPLGVLRMSGGVGVTVVPLLTIGSGQAVAAEAMCSDIDAHHWDEYSTLADKQRVVAELEKITSVEDTHVMLYISPQSLEGKDNSRALALVPVDLARHRGCRVVLALRHGCRTLAIRVLHQPLEDLQGILAGFAPPKREFAGAAR